MATLTSTRLGFGEKPALIIVDAIRGFTEPSSPLGMVADSEIDAIGRLIGMFRERGWPIIYTVNVYSHGCEASVFRQKLPVLNELAAESSSTEIDPRISARSGDLIIRKTVPSAFFDSPLRQILQNLKVDTTVVTGFSTSGCVRATAVDALQSNFRLIVVREACGDRDGFAHDANLRDIDLKYGDVVSLADALAMAGAVHVRT